MSFAKCNIANHLQKKKSYLCTKFQNCQSYARSSSPSRGSIACNDYGLPVINLVFVAVEALIGWRSGSTGLVSDAGHNLSDALGMLLSLISLLLIQHGSRRSGFISQIITLCNALILLGAVAVIAWESIERILSPIHVQGDMVIYTALAAIFVNGLSAYLLMRGSKEDINIRAAYLHAATDMLVSVGVVLSGVIISLTSWYIIDPIISLVITLIIAIPAVRLVGTALRGLIEHT